jgi:hypothetical protein
VHRFDVDSMNQGASGEFDAGGTQTVTSRSVVER